MITLLAAILISTPCYSPGLNSPCCPPHQVQLINNPDQGVCQNWFNDISVGVQAPEQDR
jgi:hypothetical protein